jgi:hypothetical protein
VVAQLAPGGPKGPGGVFPPLSSATARHPCYNLAIINSRENNMRTVTADEDGSYTITVPAPMAPAATVASEDVEVDIVITNGTTKKFVPAA